MTQIDTENSEETVCTLIHSVSLLYSPRSKQILRCLQKQQERYRDYLLATGSVLKEELLQVMIDHRRASLLHDKLSTAVEMGEKNTHMIIFISG